VDGGFSYTKETHDVKLGQIELSVKEKQKVILFIHKSLPQCGPSHMPVMLNVTDSDDGFYFTSRCLLPFYLA